MSPLLNFLMKNQDIYLFFNKFKNITLFYTYMQNKILLVFNFFERETIFIKLKYHFSFINSLFY